VVTALNEFLPPFYLSKPIQFRNDSTQRSASASPRLMTARSCCTRSRTQGLVTRARRLLKRTAECIQKSEPIGQSATNAARLRRRLRRVSIVRKLNTGRCTVSDPSSRCSCALVCVGSSRSLSGPRNCRIVFGVSRLNLPTAFDERGRQVRSRWVRCATSRELPWCVHRRHRGRTMNPLIVKQHESSWLT
jgi:hypothetical protein